MYYISHREALKPLNCLVQWKMGISWHFLTEAYNFLQLHYDLVIGLDSGDSWLF